MHNSAGLKPCALWPGMKVSFLTWHSNLSASGWASQSLLTPIPNILCAPCNIQFSSLPLWAFLTWSALAKCFHRLSGWSASNILPILQRQRVASPLSLLFSTCIKFLSSISLTFLPVPSLWALWRVKQWLPSLLHQVPAYCSILIGIQNLPGG